MSKRHTKFELYKTHPWLKKVYKKLKESEIEIAHDFIAVNDQLDKGAFELAINRMFLFNDNKPKNWTAISELLTCTNSSTD